MRLRLSLILAALLLVFVPVSSEAANWGGTIYVPVTMTKAQSPHYVTSTLTIATNAVLTIEPGAYVYFSPGAALNVSMGKLIADASTGLAITMGFNGPNGTHGSWPGIRFGSGGYATLSVMKNVKVFYGGTANEGAIWLAQAVTPTLQNVWITHSAGPGIFVNGYGQYTLSTITVQNCLGDGIVVAGPNANVLLQTSSVVKTNGGNGVDLRAGAKLRVNGLTSTYNTGWAIGGDPDTTVSSLATFTMSGNGGGTKNAFGTRSGTLAANTTWTLYSTLPRYVTGVVTVPSGKTLTIPAQTVRFTPGAALEIQGTLTSTGTAGARVTLTTSATTPAPGGWDGVRFRSTASTASTLTYTTISYATTGLLIDGYSGTLSNTTIASSSLEGVKIQGATARPTLSAVSVNNGQTDAILLATGAGATINNPTFTGNQGYPFAVEKATSPLTITGVTPPSSGGDFNNAIRMRATSIAADETWLLPPLPWVITADLTIQYGQTVTLPAGTTIRFASGKVLYAQGRLIANGTPAQPVRLTSNQSLPAPGDWGGLSIGYLSNYNVPATLTHTIVEYAGKTTAARPAVSFSWSTPVITSFTVRNSYADAVYAYNSVVTGSRLAVLDSGARSLNVFDSAVRITLPHSTFERNPQGVTGGIANVDLRLSYWGHASGPSLGGPGSGDPVPASLLYEPWLIGAPSAVNYFTAVTAKNRSFNPSVGVVAHIDHTEQLASTWTFNVYNGTTLVRTLTGSSPAVEWDGRDAGGTLQASGTYRWELAASAAGGNATPASGLAILDSTKQLIEAFAISERYFSPNGDATKDSTTATGTIGFGDSTWTLRFRNAGGTAVRTTSGSSGVFSFIWNGKNDSGTLQPDGVYTAELTATNLATSTTQTLPVDLDVIAPAASVTSPVEDAVFSNIYTAGTPVRITVQDGNLASWRLDASEGDPPVGFFGLGNGTLPMADQLAVMWDSDHRSVGRWTLRLTATDLAGNQSINDRHIWKRDLDISQTNTSDALVWEFDPDAGSMTYRSIVPFPLRETITIRNEAGVVVRTLLSDVQRAEGTYFDTWDGKNDQGQRVPDGAYFYVATVNDGTVSYTWDRSAKHRPGQPVFRVATSAEFAPFDNKPLEVTCDLPVAHKVMFQVSPSAPGAFGYYCTSLPGGTRCIEHRYRPSGPFTLHWAGTYPDGMPFADAAALRLAGDLFPENATVVYGSEPQIDGLEVQPPLVNPGSGASLRFALTLDPGVTATLAARLIRHANGATIRTIAVPGLPGGDTLVPLDGLADNGLWLPEGEYTISITITDSIGNVVTRHALMTVRY